MKDLVLLASITVVVALCLYTIYHLCFDPFGPNSRCRKKWSIASVNRRPLNLFVVDGNMPFPMIASFLGQHNYEVLDLTDLKGILDDDRSRNSLPRCARIIGRQDGVLWAIDTRTTLIGGKARETRLAPIETPSSFEDCYIGAKKAETPLAA